MSTKGTVGLAASEVAAKALGSLGADDWRRLADLGNKHAAGRLSREGWQSATLAAIEPALLRAEREVTLALKRGARWGVRIRMARGAK